MARPLLHRLSISGLSLVTALLLVWPTLVQTATPSEAAQDQPSASDFPPFWVMTFRPTTAWSGAGADAEALGQIQQWRYLQVDQPQEGGRLPTLDPRTNTRAYIEADAVGPVGPPPDDYFAAAPTDESVVGLPGRIIGTTELFERPENQRYFALDEVRTNTPVMVQAAVDGPNDSRWYRVGDDQYVPANNLRLPTPPGRTFPGRWIDANLTEPVMVTAYEGETPVYSALAVKGLGAFQTPQGTYRIQRRVQNETMDSSTIGIPRTSPQGYYLKDVLYTQYFTGDGAALHYNYWRSNWGYAGSHGCLGMDLTDSRFFWDFAGVGTVVYIHS